MSIDEQDLREKIAKIINTLGMVWTPTEKIRYHLPPGYHHQYTELLENLLSYNDSQFDTLLVRTGHEKQAMKLQLKASKVPEVSECDLVMKESPKSNVEIDMNQDPNNMKSVDLVYTLLHRHDDRWIALPEFAEFGHQLGKSYETTTYQVYLTGYVRWGIVLRERRNRVLYYRLNKDYGNAIDNHQAQENIELQDTITELKYQKSELKIKYDNVKSKYNQLAAILKDIKIE